jgi:Xaa-Pro dipeptidase
MDPDRLSHARRLKRQLFQSFLLERDAGAILLSKRSNFACLTVGGRNYVNAGSELGASSVLLTAKGEMRYVGNNIEQPRVLDEELKGFDAQARSFFWYEAIDSALSGFSHLKVISDDGSAGENVHKYLDHVRSLLTDVEVDKYRVLGKMAAECMTEVCSNTLKGMSEQEVAADLVCAKARRGVTAPVVLVAADDRIAKYRHPLPTESGLLAAGPDAHEKRIEQYVMVVGCFEKEGLVVSLTRFKAVAALDEEILDRCRRIVCVDADIMAATRPGVTLGAVLEEGQRAYQRYGFTPRSADPLKEGEWQNHHQGGLTGYDTRTILAVPGDPTPILSTQYPDRLKEFFGVETTFAQAFAWNPSAPGVKSEDTFILHGDGSKEIVTKTPEFPQADLSGSNAEGDAQITKSGIMPA